MKSKTVTLILLSLVLALVGGLAGYAYYYRQLEIVVSSEEDNLVGSKNFHVVGSIYGPKDKPFLRPLTVATYEDKIFIGDAGNGRVVIYSARGRFLGTLGDKGDSRTKLLMPTDLTVDRDGLLWVADRQSGRVMVYNQEGELQKSIPEGEDRIKLNGFSPLSLTFDANNQLIVFDVYQQRLVQFDAQGQFVKELYRDPQGLLTFVNGVVSGKKRTLLANSNLGQIMELKANKTQEIKGIPKGKGFMPRGMSFNRSEDVLFITEMFGHKIFVYNLKTGRVIDTLGTNKAKRLFNYPNDVALDEDNRIIVADKSNNRIVIIEPKD